jgi:uncharacterized membrane protein YeaQ/YmgE (transglycosylase-associated protein family)
MTALFVWIILGLIAGFLSAFLIRGTGLGLVGDIVLGILGAIVGGFLASTFLGLSASTLSPVSIAIAFAGAIMLLLLFSGLRVRA